MKIIALSLVLLGLPAPVVSADETKTSETAETWLFVRTTPFGAKTEKGSNTQTSVTSPQAQLVPRKLFAASHGLDINVLAVAFSPDGKTLAAVDEAARVTVCDARSGRQTTGFDLLTPEESELVFHRAPRRKIHCGAVAFSPDGRTLAVGGGPMVKLFDAGTGKLRLALDDEEMLTDLDGLGGLPTGRIDLLAAIARAHGSVYCVAFSPDGTTLATSGRHIFMASGAMAGHLKLWDAKTGDLKRSLGEHFGQVPSVAFSPDGKTLAAAGVHPPGWTESVRVWDPRTGAVIRVHQCPRGDPWSVAFSPNGKLVAAGGIVAEGDDKTSGMVMVWSVRTGAMLLQRPLPTPVVSVAFSPDGTMLATGEYKRGVTLRDPETLAARGEINPIDPPSDIDGPVRLAYSPAGNLLAITAEHKTEGGIVTVWSSGKKRGRE